MLHLPEYPIPPGRVLFGGVSADFALTWEKLADDRGIKRSVGACKLVVVP